MPGDVKVRDPDLQRSPKNLQERCTTPTRGSILREEKGIAAIPVDVESRLQLARHETIVDLHVEPVRSDSSFPGLSR